MKPIENQIQVDAFHHIVSSHGIDIEYSQSDTYSVTFKGKEKLIKLIEMTIDSGTLRIKWKNELTGFLRAKFLNRSAIVAHVCAPTLTEIDLSTGTDFYTERIFNEKDLTINISNGSGLKAKIIEASNVFLHLKSSDIEIDNLKSTNLVIENASGSDVEIQNLEAEDVKINSSGSSDTELSGEIHTLNINTKENSDIDIKKLKYQFININNTKDSEIYK